MYHSHVRLIRRDLEWTTISTQLLLPGDVERAVFESEPYASRGQNPINLRRDIVIKGDQKKLDTLTVDSEKDRDGFVGSCEIAMAAL